MSENLPVPVRPEVPAMGRDLLTNLGEIERVAIACASSGYYKDVRDASQAVVKMLAGREMGIGPIQSLAGIHIVEGKPTAGANVIAANVKRSGRYDYRVKERTNTQCVLEWFESGKSVGESSFTEADAKLAGLAGKNNWKKYPRAMYFARALTEGVRVFCPDAGAGVIYTPEELAPDMEVTESGDVVNGVIVEPTPKTPPQRPALNPERSAIGQRLLVAMESRCNELKISPADYAKGGLNSILLSLKIEKNAAQLTKHHQTILDHIEVWHPPSAGDDFAAGPPEGSEAKEQTLGTAPKEMASLHAWMGEEAGVRDSESAHAALHAALPVGVDSLRDLPVSKVAELKERVLANEQAEQKGAA